MPQPRVLILYNEPTLPVNHPDSESEHDVLFTADAVSRCLQEAGLVPARLGVTYDTVALLNGVREAAPDVVFNLYEGTAGWGNSEAYVCGLLELLRIPYTGSPVEALALCRSKPLTKRLLAGAGLPTAPCFVVPDGPVPPCSLPWPVIVKPGMEDASVGIDQKSVVTSQQQLEERVEYLRAHYGPSVLVEQFLRGREFNVPLIVRDGQPTPLPFTEILFKPPAEAPDLWPLTTFNAKWHPGTTDFVATPAVNPAENVSEQLHAEVSRLAIESFKLCDCRDYARVDFRLDEADRPYILEVNPNPCISPLAGLAAALESTQIPYGEFILDLVKQALLRGPRPALADTIGTPVRPDVERIASPKRPRVRVRPARRADLEAVERLLTGTEAWTTEERERAAKRIADRLTRRNRGGWQCLVLASRGEVAGYACLRPDEDSPGVMILDGLVIDPDHRRAGQGRTLLQAVEAAAATAGGRFVLATLSSAPLAGVARQFLSACGYRTAGEFADYYPGGVARMSFVKRLGAPAESESSPSTAPAAAPQSVE